MTANKEPWPSAPLAICICNDVCWCLSPCRVLEQDAVLLTPSAATMQGISKAGVCVLGTSRFPGDAARLHLGWKVSCRGLWDIWHRVDDYWSGYKGGLDGACIHPTL